MQFRGFLALTALSAVLSLDAPKASALLLYRTWQASEVVEQSSIICRARVLSTQSQWREDDRGRHIYTRVWLGVGQWFKGRTSSPILDLEVVGGTVGEITETVSDAPVFIRGEQALLFLQGSPLQVVGGIGGKVPIFSDRVFWNGRPVPVGTLALSLGSDRHWPPRNLMKPLPPLNSRSIRRLPASSRTAPLQVQPLK